MRQADARQRTGRYIAGVTGGKRNPWLEIPATDYEGHMGPGGGDQLSVLARLFGETYARYRPRRLVVVGCATGNGLEHVTPATTERLVAIDINLQYLQIARARFPDLAPVLEPICAPAERCDLELGVFDLVQAALVFEYLDPAALVARVASWLRPGGLLSAVLQLPSPDHPAITATPYQSLRALEPLLRLVDPGALTEIAAREGLEGVEASEVPLRSGKRFWVARFARAVRA